MRSRHIRPLVGIAGIGLAVAEPRVTRTATKADWLLTTGPANTPFLRSATIES